jgi:4-amino-4-deoxy-L-arabinose transferase-like glycosyltransferase
MSRPSPHSSANLRTAPPRDNTLLAALILLLLTAAIAFTWSHVKLLSQDEFFVLQTDSVSSVHELIHIQRSFPISLDPLVFHLLAHAATKVFGPRALALRLPSIFGFLLMQICIFFATRRIAGPRAGLIAMAFPALTATLFYAPEARPYGLLLGLYALAFLCWQTATRHTTFDLSSRPEAHRAGAEKRGPRRARLAGVQRPAVGPTEISNPTPRTGALILLALAIALALNTHYFGVLILVPIFLAELARTLLRRTLDLPMAAAILIGCAGIVFVLPFQHAAGEFRKHYYNAGAISLRAITQAYRSLFVSYTTQPLAVQRLEAVLLSLFAIALILISIRRIRSAEIALPRPELVFLLALVALPLFGVLLAMFVTHSIEVRYVLSAIIAVAIFFAIAVEPLLRGSQLRTRISAHTLTALLAFGILLAGFIRIRDEQQQSSATLAQLVLTPALKSQLLSLPDSHLYIQDMGHFEVASFYEPDPEVRQRMALLYSRDEELKYDLHDTASLTAEHMQHFTGFTIVPFTQLKSAPGGHMLVLYHSGWDWTDQALAANKARITPLGSAMGGDIVQVQLRHEQ